LAIATSANDPRKRHDTVGSAVNVEPDWEMSPMTRRSLCTSRDASTEFEGGILKDAHYILAHLSEVLMIFESVQDEEAIVFATLCFGAIMNAVALVQTLLFFFFSLILFCNVMASTGSIFGCCSGHVRP